MHGANQTPNQRAACGSLKTRRAAGVACVLLLATGAMSGLLATSAMAGIPEPGVILYGKVFDEAGELLTSGELAWSYETESGGAPLVINARLQAIEGVGGPYSYRVLVPLETGVEGFPVSPQALTASDSPVAYIRSASVAGTTINMTHTVALSRADRGTALRVDVCASCTAVVRVNHSADLNEDFRFTLSEFLRALELHAGTDSHEYHADAAGEDGYGLGPGPQDGLPHSMDFEFGADWRISMTEALRMVDLFMSSPDHSYHPDSTGDDGFNKGLPDLPAPPGLTKSMDSDPLGLTVNRHLVAGSLDPLSQTLEFILEFDAANAKSISALGIQEYLPEGWSFAGMVDGADPFIVPKLNDSGVVEFAWLTTPELPHRFSYTVAMNPSADLLGGLEQLSGQGVYRTVGGNRLHRASLSTTLFHDDGDGVPDVLETLASLGGAAAGSDAPAGARAAATGAARAAALAQAPGRVAPEASALGSARESGGRFDMSARTAPGEGRGAPAGRAGRVAQGRNAPVNRAAGAGLSYATSSSRSAAPKAAGPGVPSQSPLGLIVLGATIGFVSLVIMRRRRA